MRVNKEFKNEFDQEFVNTSYITRKIAGKAFFWIILATIVFGAMGIIGKYITTNTDRVIFKQSVTYNEGVLDDLAKYKFEYDTAEDDVEREAIIALVRGRFANYDKSKIENRDLLYFLKECGL